MEDWIGDYTHCCNRQVHLKKRQTDSAELLIFEFEQSIRMEQRLCWEEKVKVLCSLFQEAVLCAMVARVLQSNVKKAFMSKA